VAKRNRKVKLSSLIVVGEGPHDKAFINHMKDLYDNRTSGQKVKVESADGGSPMAGGFSTASLYQSQNIHA